MVDGSDEERGQLARSRMSFGEHLEELRRRLWRALLWSLLGLVVTFCFHRDVLAFVIQPFREVMLELSQDPTLKTMGPAHAFFAYVKVSFVVGLIFTAPMWIWQIWAFIAAGLFTKERKSVYKYVPFCVILFLAGVTFGYLVLIPLGLRYLITFADPTVIQNWIGLKDYLGLFTVLTLVLGFTFQMPMIMIGVARLGLMGPEGFRRKRKWMILGIFVGAAVLTPPDPVTQCLLATPLIGLYELGIYISWLGMGKDRPPIDWKTVKPRFLKLGAVVALLVVFWQPLQGLWLERQSEDRLYQDQEGRPDLRSLCGDLLKVALGRDGIVPVGNVYRTDEVGREVILVCDALDKAWIVRLETGRRNSIPLNEYRETDEGPRITVGFWIAGTAVFDACLVKEIPYSRVVPKLIDALRHGSEETGAAVRPMLEKLMGVGAGLSEKEALTAFERWYESHADAMHSQPR